MRRIIDHKYYRWHFEYRVREKLKHYNDVITGAITSQITGLTIVYSIVYSEADQRTHQSSASLAFVRGIHRGPLKSPHKRPVTWEMFPFDDVIMESLMSIPYLTGQIWLMTTVLLTRASHWNISPEPIFNHVCIIVAMVDVDEIRGENYRIWIRPQRCVKTKV